jgi:ABC-2 type transport system ATP-binding protein
MRVGAFLTYIAGLKGVDEDVAVQRAERLLEQLGLTDTMKKKCEDLSKGMLQRVQFVGSIINQPDLLILDEPFSGLDPVSVRMMKAVIAAEHQRGATILLSTHVMAHAEELCEHVVMLHQGRKVLDEPMSGLRRQFDTRSVRLEALDPDADFSTLRSLPGVELVTPTANGCDIRLADGTDPAAAIRSLASVVAPARIELARVRLEDVFVRLVTERAGTEDSEVLRSHLQGLNTGGAA